MQQLLADAARDAKRRRQPAGKMPAARDVLKAAEFDLCGVVGMPGTWHVYEVLVVLRTGVGVSDDSAERRAAGYVSDET